MDPDVAEGPDASVIGSVGSPTTKHTNHDYEQLFIGVPFLQPASPRTQVALSLLATQRTLHFGLRHAVQSLTQKASLNKPHHHSLHTRRPRHPDPDLSGEGSPPNEMR
jgi:hypothetical protein